MSYHYTPDSKRSPLDRQPPNVFSGGQVPSFKTNVNRMKTKRWIEAKAPSYDDWDDYDDGYGPGPSQEQQPPPSQPNNQGSPTEPSRSFTDPHAMPTHTPLQRKPSFDAGDDRRTLSSSAYAQPPLITRAIPPAQAQHLVGGPTMSSPVAISPTAVGGPRGLPQAHVPSGANPSHPPPDDRPAVSGSRQSSNNSWSQSIVSDAPSAQMDPQQRRDFTPSALPPPLQTRTLPAPGDNVGGQFPLRKASLSRSSPASAALPQLPVPPASEQVGVSSRQLSPSNTGKALPIIRPSEIYKRMEEEREKERRSMESSRPSMDSITSRPGEDVTQPRKPLEIVSSESLARGSTQRSSGDRTADDGDPPKPLKTTLEPVVERQSEYMPGFSLPQEGPPELSAEENRVNTESSIRPESTESRIGAGLDGSSGMSGTPALPEVSRISTFGDDFWTGHFRGPERASSELEQQRARGDISTVPTYSSGPLGTPRDTHQIARNPSPSPPHSRNASAAISSVPTSHAEQSTVPPSQVDGPGEQHGDAVAKASSSNMSPPPDYTTREADLPIAARVSPAKDLDALGNKEKASQATFLESRKSLNPSDFDEPSSGTSSPVLRSESPTKGRVKDLAGKFNDITESRRNSTQSTSFPKGSLSPTKSTDDDTVSTEPPLPVVERAENIATDLPSRDRPVLPHEASFRPQLPGQWDSFSNATVPNAATTEKSNEFDMTPHSPSQGKSFPLPVHDEDEKVDLAPTTFKQSASPSASTASSNPLSALVAAGDAIGESIEASAGFGSSQETDNTEASPSLEPSFARDCHPVGDIYIRPLAPDRAISSLTASSVAPTPPPKENPFDTEKHLHVKELGPPVPSKDGAADLGSLNESRALAQEITPAKSKLSIEVSADDQESDRLRKAIVLSLSPAQSQANSAATSADDFGLAPAASLTVKGYRDSSILPAEYDSYWAGADDEEFEQIEVPEESNKDASRGLGQQLPDPGHDEAMLFTTNAAVDDTNPPTGAESQSDLLGKRFSWEQSSQTASQQNKPAIQEDASLPIIPEVASSGIPPNTSAYLESSSGAPSSSPLLDTNANTEELGMPSALPSKSSQPSPIVAKEVNERDNALPEPPVIPTAEPEPSSADRDGQTSSIGEEQRFQTQSLGPTEEQTAPAGDVSPTGQAQSAQPRFPFFREIMAMKSSPERISTYNKTREQFATSDSGLRDWLGATLAAKPEHAELKSLGIQPPGPAPGPGQLRHKHTASLSLFGKGSTPYYQQYIDSASQVPGTGTAGSVSNSPTAVQPQGSDKFPANQGMATRLTGHQMQAKGKDLLHSAGVLGGKATISAKGLFAKGKNKFRSSGSEKAPSSSTSRKPSSERASHSASEREKRRSISISSFRRPRSRPSSIVVPHGHSDFGSIHSQETNSGSLGPSKRHSYAGESWYDFLASPKSTTPERLGVLPSPAVSAFTASQVDLQPTQRQHPPLPKDAQTKILRSVMRHSTPPFLEQAQTEHNETLDESSPAPKDRTQNPGGVSPVDQVDEDEPNTATLNAGDGQPLGRAISPLVSEKPDIPVDVSPISDQSINMLDHSEGVHPKTTIDSDDADSREEQHRNTLIAPSDQKPHYNQGSSPAQPFPIQHTQPQPANELKIVDKMKSVLPNKLHNLVSAKISHKPKGGNTGSSSLETNQFVRRVDTAPNENGALAPSLSVSSSGASSQESRHSALLQSLSDAVVADKQYTHNSLPIGESFAVRVVATPPKDAMEMRWGVPHPALRLVPSTPHHNVPPPQDDPERTKEPVKETQSPLSDDELYTDDGGAIPPPSNQFHEQIVISQLSPPEQTRLGGELSEEELLQTIERAPPRPPFLERSSRHSASSADSRPMSFVTLPRDEDGMPQEQINRATLDQPQTNKPSTQLRPGPGFLQQISNQVSAQPQSEEISLHRYQPQQHTKPSKGRRVSGSAPLPNLTHHEHRPLEPDIAYGQISHPKEVQQHSKLQHATENHVIDPRQHAVEYQLPGVGPPTTSPQESKLKFTALLRGRNAPSSAKSSGGDRINPQLVAPEPHRNVSYESTVGDLQSEQPSDKRKPRTSALFKTHKRPDSIGQESQLSGISAFTRDSTTANAADSRLDLRYPSTPRQGIPPSLASSERRTSNTPQRESTSGISDIQKRKRFSGLGSLFKRSESTSKLTTKFSRSDQKSKMPTLQGSPPTQPVQSSRPLQQAAVSPPPSSAYASNRIFNHRPAQQTQMTNAEAYGNKGQTPPLGGYYAPGNWTSDQATNSFGNTAEQNPRRNLALSTQRSPSGPLYDARNATSPQQNQQQIGAQSPENESTYDTPDIPAAYNMNPHVNGVTPQPPRSQGSSDNQRTAAWRRHSHDQGPSPHNPSFERHSSTDSPSSQFSRRVSEQSQTQKDETRDSTPVISPVSSNSSRAPSVPNQYSRVQAPRMNSISEIAQHQERPWNISLPLDVDEDSDHSRRLVALNAQGYLPQPENRQPEQPHPLSQPEFRQPTSQQQTRPQLPQLRLQTSTDSSRRVISQGSPQANTMQPPSTKPLSATTPSSPMQRYREILPRGIPQSLQPPPISQSSAIHPLRTSIDRTTSRNARSPASAHPANLPLPTSPGSSSPINPLAVGFPAPPPPGQQYTSKSLEPRAGVQELPAQMDDDDEPVMRAVSYPGMEWVPTWEE